MYTVDGANKLGSVISELKLSDICPMCEGLALFLMKSNRESPYSGIYLLHTVSLGHKACDISPISHEM